MKLKMCQKTLSKNLSKWVQGHRILLAATLVTFNLLSSPVVQAGSNMRLGAVTYWANEGHFSHLPAASIAIINPDNGILASANKSLSLSSQLFRYKEVVTKNAKRGVLMLGYVPTGYFKHECNPKTTCQTWARIEAQIKGYFSNYPQLSGIFFDEASGSDECVAISKEYQRLRDLVRKIKPSAQVAFNPGTHNDCIINATRAGEILVVFEGTAENYLTHAESIKIATRKAASRKVLPWHLVHSVGSETLLKVVFLQAFIDRVDFFYATNVGGNWQAGENTWGDFPSIWEQEMGLFNLVNAKSK